LAAIAAFLLATACTSSDDESTAHLIHRLLLAAASAETGNLESYPGELPPDMPAEPPLYPDADIVVSSIQPTPAEDAGDGAEPAPETLLYFIVLDTSDSRADVRSFYEEALEEDPWQLESSFSTEHLDTIQFLHVEDADLAGVVSISEGGEDGHTTILISFQDAGATTEEEAEFEPPESLALPSNFPDDVPTYEGAIVTGTAFFREPQNESFLLVQITTDAAEDVLAFYTEAFEANGWTVTPAQSLGLEDTIDFSAADDSLQGNLIVQTYSESDDYIEATMQFRQDPGRTSGEEEADGDATEEPEPDGEDAETTTPTQQPAP
jgi:predicted enzyme related to lactoylglutathione lyase